MEMSTATAQWVAKKVTPETFALFDFVNVMAYDNDLDKYRRLNKQRSVFPSDTALLKALYLATHEIAKKWTMPLRNWGKVLGELEIMYPDRLG